MASNERIWYEDVSTFLFNQETLTKFIPDKNMELVEQLNSIMRFALYFTLIVLIIKRDYRVVYFVVFIGIVTFIIYQNHVKQLDSKKELFEKLNITQNNKQKKCYKPTKNNPFMNVLLPDYVDFANRPPACKINNTNVMKDVSKFFNENLVRDATDIFSKNASDREFYTTPSTTIPNNQTTFAEWLYKVPKTCKENNLQCDIH